MVAPMGTDIVTRIGVFIVAGVPAGLAGVQVNFNMIDIVAEGNMVENIKLEFRS